MMTIKGVPSNCAVCPACAELSRDEYECGFTGAPLGYAGLSRGRGEGCPMIPAHRRLAIYAACLCAGMVLARLVR